MEWIITGVWVIVVQLAVVCAWLGYIAGKLRR